jgi:hypothetical protein
MITKYYVVKIYVGPVHVAHYADTARMAGLTDVIQGTEHVYGVIDAPALRDETDRLCLRQRVADLVYGAPMAAGWRDVDILRAT